MEDLVQQTREQAGELQALICLDHLAQPCFSKLFLAFIHGFGNAVTVKDQDVAWFELGFAGFAFLFWEQSQDCCRGMELLHAAVIAD